MSWVPNPAGPKDIRSLYFWAFEQFKGIGTALNETNLNDLADVEITSPADGEVLTYESSSGKWKNKP